MQQQKIEFRKERDFSAVLGDALKFLKQNFKPLLLSIILIIGPFILILGITYSYMQTVIMSNSMSSLGGNMFNEQYFTSLGIVYLLFFINMVLLNSVVSNYMCIYNEKPFGEKITVSEVAKRFWSTIGNVLISMLAFIFAIIVVIIAVVLMGIGFGSMGIAVSIIIGLIAFFGLLIVSPVIMYAISAGFFVVVRDKKFIFSALGIVRRYLSGSFWWTWLILVIAIIAVGVLQVLFNLPASIVVLTDTFSRVKHIKDGLGTQEYGNSTLLITLYTIGMFLSTCSSSILHLVCGFHFLSQEEKHEGKGLLSRIDEIK